MFTETYNKRSVNNNFKQMTAVVCWRPICFQIELFRILFEIISIAQFLAVTDDGKRIREGRIYVLS